jgi:hypothetical protein
LTKSNSLSARALKEKIDDLTKEEQIINKQYRSIHDSLRKLKEQYNKTAYKDMIGKCYKVKSWADDERDEDPYWMYMRIVGLFSDDRCLIEEFSLQGDKPYGRPKRESFSYQVNQDSFIHFYKAKDHIEIPKKEYHDALKKALKHMHLTDKRLPEVKHETVKP